MAEPLNNGKSYIVGWRHLPALLLLALGSDSVIAQPTDMYETLIREMTINGVEENPASTPIMGRRDTIALQYACKTTNEKRMPFLFSVTLAAEKSGLRRTETINASSVKYTGLPEDTYTFTVFSYVPGQWKTEPKTIRFTVNTANAPKRVRPLPKTENEDNDEDSTQQKQQDSLSKVMPSDSSLPWVPITSIAGILALAGGAYFAIKKNKTKPLPFQNNLNISENSSKDIMNSSEEKNQQLVAENAQLRAELAALRGQIDAMQVRGDELYKRNKELEDSIDKISKNKNELEELQKQKDELFAMVIHDMKNPAGLIKGLVELLRSYDLSASEQGEVLDDLVETSRKIVALSQEVCKVMALESGHMNLNYETTSVENIIQLVARRNESAAKLKSMGIMLEIPSDLPEVHLDVHKIEDVVDNLVNNAIKYSHNGGKIRIRAYKQDKEMVVEVSDNGLGLSEEDIKNAFQRGAKLSARPTAGELSSGLGLWLVKRIVEEHKGRVWVRSSLGRGSTFAFQLPIEPPR